MEANIEDPYILIYIRRSCKAADIVPLLEKLVQGWQTRDLDIAEDVVCEALATLVLNKIRVCSTLSL
jgi:chaperonin GroEL (HSP60 family)